MTLPTRVRIWVCRVLGHELETNEADEWPGRITGIRCLRCEYTAGRWS